MSPLELFFDLVFVFTITQLTYSLAEHPDFEGLAQVALILGLVWWMYGGFAWLTNSVAPDRDSRRLLLLGGMACFMLIALAIPTAFEGDGDLFALAYFAVIVLHVGLFRRAWAESAARSILMTVRFNLAAATLVLIGSLVAGDTLEYACWALALLVVCSSIWLQDSTGFRIRSAHFVERHDVVMIVALGESVIVVGSGAADQPLTAQLLFVVLLGLGVAACLWWSYFSGPDDEAEGALDGFPEERRPAVALYAYYLAYLPLLLGIVAVAAGLKEAIAHPYDELPFGSALSLGGGAALFLLGEVAFRRALGLGHTPWRLVGAALALATVPLGTEGSALLQLAVLVPALALCLLGDRRAGERGLQPAGAR